MSDLSPTRRQLENALRGVLPDQATIRRFTTLPTPNAASAGIGGLLTGYFWGWIRGRRTRSKRQG